MRHGISSAVLLAVAFLGGCASKPVAKTPAIPHFSIAMDVETQRALLGEDDEVAVSTTTLTSAELLEVPLAKESAKEAAPLPDDRGSLSSPDVLRTWGTDVEGIPTAREE